MTRINKLPLMALAFGAMMTAATVAWAEGETTDMNSTTGTTIEATAKWARGGRTMETVYGYPIASSLGLCALPVRTPIKRLLIANQQVVPGLGVEGELLAAWSAARVVSRSDKRPAVLRRGLWTKLEG